MPKLWPVRKLWLIKSEYKNVVFETTPGEAIDGIVTDITAGNPQVLAVAKVGDIVFATIGTGGAKVGDELAVEAGGKLVKQASQAKTVAKALATGNANERIPVIIK